MKLAYSSNAFTRTDLMSALLSIAELGYAGAEILCDAPHWQPRRVSRDDVEAVMQLLQERALGVSNLNVNTANAYFQPLPPENVFEPALSSRHADWREWRIRYTLEALQLAQAVGANCISVTSGHPASGGDPDTGLELFVNSLRQICHTAEQLDIRVGIEYEPGLLVERASEVAAVIERVGSPQLGVNLDIGHSYLAGESPEAVVELLGGRIWNVHVEDIRERKHFHRIPGEGELPIERYVEALHNQGYDGYLTVELYTYPNDPVGAGKKSLNYLSLLIAPWNESPTAV